MAATTLLVIQDAPQAIHDACAIFNFIILAQYLLHNDETLSYIEDALYKFDKRKNTFENYCPININLYLPAFKYEKLHAMTHFI